MRLKINKTRAIISHIREVIPRCPKYKLFFILFNIDMENYLRTGESMTGLNYIKGKRRIEPSPEQWARVS